MTNRERVLGHLRYRPGATCREIADALAMPLPSARVQLARLYAQAVVRRNGSPYRYELDASSLRLGPEPSEQAADDDDWEEVAITAADIAEDLGLQDAHPIAVLTTLHDRIKAGRAA